MADNTKPGAEPVKSKRGDPTKAPVARKMSRADSLSSMNEFGAVVPLEKQAALRKPPKKLGPINSAWASLMGALRGK